MLNFFISPKDKKDFPSLNRQIKNIHHYPTLDPKTIEMSKLRESELISDTCEFTKESLCESLAHIALWGNVAEAGRPAHIFPNKAVLCDNFEKESQRIIDLLPPDWDFILWGAEPGSPLYFSSLPGLAIFTGMLCPPYQDNYSEIFPQCDVSGTPFPLQAAFKPCGYAISPAGAKKLIKSCLPLTPMPLPLPLHDDGENTARHLFEIMGMEYPNIKAFVSFPGLCLPSE